MRFSAAIRARLRPSGKAVRPTPRPRRSVVCRGHRCWRHHPVRTAVSRSRRRCAGSARRREARRKAHRSRARHHGLHLDGDLSADDREELAGYRSGRCQLNSPWTCTIRASLLIDFVVFVLRPVELTVQNRTLPYGLGATLES